MTTTPAMPEHHVPIALVHLSNPDREAVLRYAESYALATLQAQPAEVSDAEWWHEVLGSAGPDLLGLAKKWDANEVHVYQFVNEAEKIVKAAAQRAILALRPQSESEQEKELRRSLAEAQATISERNAEIIELQKRIRRSPQAVPMTDEVKEKALDLLATMFDAYENGVPCHEGNDGGYIGMAFSLDDETFHACADILNAHRPKAHHGVTAPAGGEG